MPIGRVKWFNNSKGYGFILADRDDGSQDDAGEDLFVHYSSIQMDGYRTLKAGEAVEFDLQRADRGYHAVNVRRAEARAATREDDAQATTPAAAATADEATQTLASDATHA